MSADFVGSSYGASSTSSGASSILTQSILGAVSLAGENIALNNETVGLSVPRVSAPPPAASATIFPKITGTGSSSWLVIIIVVIIGFFAYREL